MSSIMRWRSGLMGLSDIAKTPVSHGVEPHDFETGPGLRVPLSAHRPPAAHSPLLPRERFSPHVDSGHGGSFVPCPLSALLRHCLSGTKRKIFTTRTRSLRLRVSPPVAVSALGA